MLKTLARAFIAGSLILIPTMALAWGEPGHEVVGSIAEQILAKDHPNAAQHVQQILASVDLAVAATWPDCVRDVVKTSSGFAYRPGRYTPKVCAAFQNDADEARMIDYASRNWDDCYYSATEGCHAAYHFADVAIQRSRYDRSYVGTSDHDIVSAINAAILVLQGQAAPAPFSIKDQKEALFLLAHFVGDLHQPLHVGAIYLDANGSVEDPDSSPDQAANWNTEGANLIMDGSENLHHEWDTIASSLGTSASPDLVAEAEAVPPTPGPISSWAADWASDTVQQAQTAFQGLTFTGVGARKWTVQFADRDGYQRARADEQEHQLVKAGARLAQLLAAIWPDAT